MVGDQLGLGLIVLALIGESYRGNGGNRPGHAQGLGEFATIAHRIVEVEDPSLHVPETRSTMGIEGGMGIDPVLVPIKALIGPLVDGSPHAGPRLLGPGMLNVLDFYP